MSDWKQTIIDEFSYSEYGGILIDEERTQELINYIEENFIPITSAKHIKLLKENEYYRHHLHDKINETVAVINELTNKYLKG